MASVLQLVHGYPPREVAGTEVYTQRLTDALVARGWTVHVVAATRAPGRRHGSVTTETLPGGGDLVRVVNNLPWRPLGNGEKDSLIEGRVRSTIHGLGPDLVHVQHLLFLSAHLHLKVPAVGTLHDAWGWCARAGNLLKNGDAPCAGPEPEACATCYASFSRGSRMEHQLSELAGRASRLIDPDRLHRLWRHLPASIRKFPRKSSPMAASPADVRHRQRAVAAAFRRLDRRVAPSRFLAALAEENGLGATSHLPHGVAPGPARVGGGPLVFVGSLAPHKGPHLVAEACRGLDLEIWGPATDASYAASLPNVQGALAPQDVPELLSRASALVMGSIWPENAPLIALEARASGCPVIAPRIGGLPELIEDGVDGWLYEPGNVRDMRRAVDAVLAAPPVPTPPLLFEEHVDRVEALYREVL
ncbi:MAG: glycosyltransferase family 4 protein [Proteobacteria bacterium]|nr:glycosyltransferase family 4 protein [Pseudomonadota bacterium]MCP4917690.1 glycosyltransferase family 4 protein [Pseudomonadota bacterium]